MRYIRWPWPLTRARLWQKELDESMIAEAIISVVLATSWISRTYPAGKVVHESVFACVYSWPFLDAMEYQFLTKWLYFHGRESLDTESVEILFERSVQTHISNRIRLLSLYQYGRYPGLFPWKSPKHRPDGLNGVENRGAFGRSHYWDSFDSKNIQPRDMDASKKQKTQRWVETQIKSNAIMDLHRCSVHACMHESRPMYGGCKIFCPARVCRILQDILCTHSV